jgi:hypothetical protein
MTARRYFGELPVGGTQPTDKYGIAWFDAPADLPAERNGYMKLTARVNDQTGNVSNSTASGFYPIGKKNDAPSLIEGRAWWSTRDKAPVWIIFVYSSALLTVWGFIFYILLAVRKIRTFSQG